MTSDEFSSYCFFFRIPAQGLYTGPGYFRNWPVERSLLANFMLFMAFYGGQGQNRTADTGIFRASKINNLLISLKQGFFGTVRDSYVDSVC